MVAINTKHKVSVHDVEESFHQPATPGTIEVKSDNVPSFVIRFNSASSNVNLLHQHLPSKVPRIVQKTFSEDEPQILKHQVMKPIIQEVHEIITPYRRIVKEMKPVMESIDTIVSANRKAVEPDYVPEEESFKTKPMFEVRKKKAPQSDIQKEIQMPDFILKENELIDNSLYNGNNELDMKYVSRNDHDQIDIHNYHLDQLLYKDR